MRRWQRLVIKVGSALVAPDGGDADRYIAAIGDFVRRCQSQQIQVIIVSSGSVAAGRRWIAHGQQASIAEKQAMAAIGQSQLMARWAALLPAPVAQVLLTSGDLHDRQRYVNIMNTLRELLKNGAIPIVNENDTVAVNELKVGDNDNLAAYTALVAEADALLICSDVDGLFDADPRLHQQARLLPSIQEINKAVLALAGDSSTSVGTGGMRTKLQAAQKCMHSGIHCWIFNGKNPANFAAWLEGQAVGSHFVAKQRQTTARQQWLQHTLASRGQIHIDDGAMIALTKRGASLLPSGVVGTEGAFQAGDGVTLMHNQQPLAKGLSLYGASELSAIQGLKSTQISDCLGYSLGEVIVHRNDLVLLKSGSIDE